MKVSELIEILKEQDQDSIVVMSKDGEGNGYSPLSSVEGLYYQADNSWSGQVIDDDNLQELKEELSAEEFKAKLKEDDIVKAIYL